MSLIKLFKDDKLQHSQLKDLISKSPIDFINNYPIPSHMHVTLVILNRRKTHFLGAYRGNSVKTANRLWVAGVNETMRTGFDYYDIFNTMHRGMKKELGLPTDKYDKIKLAFMGIVPPRLGVNVIGVTRLLIDQNELFESKSEEAYDSFEYEKLKWFRLDQETLFHFLLNKENKINDENESYIKVDKGPLRNRMWLNQVPICLKSAFVMKNMFED